MPLTQTSVSALTLFDPSQKGGCERRWWFEHVVGKAEAHKSAEDGEKGHALLAAYLLFGTLPKKHVKMGKAVLGAIVKGDLPKPGLDLRVEERFDGGPKYLESCKCGHGLAVHGTDGKCAAEIDPVGHGYTCECAEPRPVWRPLESRFALHLAGVPLDGFIDLSYCRGDLPTVIDHKFKADLTDKAQFPPELCEPADLIKTIQLPVYVEAERRRWPDARHWRIGHHYVSRRGVVSKLVTAVVSTDQVAERIAHVEGLIERMKSLADVRDQNEVPFNRRACTAWLGCPHQANCRAWKENQVNLSPDEAALFDDLPPGPTAPPLPPPAEAAGKMQITPDPAYEKDCADADALGVTVAQLHEMRAKAAATKKAKAEAEAKAKADAEAAAKAAQPPPAPAPQPEAWPNCADCGAPLSAQNASRLTGGAIKHISCPAKAAPAPAAAQPEPPKRGPGRPPKGGSGVTTLAPSAHSEIATAFLLDVIAGKPIGSQGVIPTIFDRVQAAAALLK